MLCRHIWEYTSEWVYHVGQALSDIALLPALCLRLSMKNKQAKNILDGIVVLSFVKFLDELIYSISNAAPFSPEMYNANEYYFMLAVIIYVLIKSREIKNGCEP